MCFYYLVNKVYKSLKNLIFLKKYNGTDTEKLCKVFI